jgi:hypothetical protein
MRKSRIGALYFDKTEPSKEGFYHEIVGRLRKYSSVHTPYWETYYNGKLIYRCRIGHTGAAKLWNNSKHWKNFATVVE